MNAHVLGFDLGTSYFKAVLVNGSGACVGYGRRPTPKKNVGSAVTIAEDDFWHALRDCTQDALLSAGIPAEAVAGVSYASQANTFLLLDAGNRPLTDIYVWPTVFDRAVEPALEDFWKDPLFLKTTGLGFTNPDFAMAKLCWLRRNRPEIWRHVAMVASLSDYFLFGLTACWSADPSTASLLGYYDPLHGSWWSDGLEVLGLDPSKVPELKQSGTVAGVATVPGSARLGLMPGTFVFAGGLDHIMAALGAGLGTYADLSESTGTVLACVALRNEFAPSQGISVGPFPESGRFACLSFHSVGAEIIESYRDRYFPHLSIDDMLALSRTSPVGSSGVSCRDDVDAAMPLEDRITGRTGRASDDVRSMLETISHRILILGYKVCKGERIERFLATGGANRSIDLLAIKADMFGAEAIACRHREPGAFGAALLAARGLGWFPSLRKAQEMWQDIDRRIPPDAERHKQYLQWLQGRSHTR